MKFQYFPLRSHLFIHTFIFCEEEGTFNHHPNPGAKVGVVFIKGREIRSALELFESNIDI